MGVEVRIFEDKLMMLQESSKRFHASIFLISATANIDVEELVTWAGKAHENKIWRSGAISEYPTICLHISERFRTRYIEMKGI